MLQLQEIHNLGELAQLIMEKAIKAHFTMKETLRERQQESMSWIEIWPDHQRKMRHQEVSSVERM